jgi:hypothetical protein
MGGRVSEREMDPARDEYHNKADYGTPKKYLTTWIIGGTDTSKRYPYKFE